MRKLEDSLRSLATLHAVGDPVRHIALRISGIEMANEGDFIRRSLGILRAIGTINPEISTGHYKQFGLQDIDNCPPDVLAAIALRVLHERSTVLLHCSVTELADHLTTTQKVKS